MDFIHAIEAELGIPIQKNMMPIQPGDVPQTYADVEDLIKDLGYKPETNIKTGIKRFLDWYRTYYGS